MHNVIRNNLRQKLGGIIRKALTCKKFHRPTVTALFCNFYCIMFVFRVFLLELFKKDLCTLYYNYAVEVAMQKSNRKPLDFLILIACDKNRNAIPLV